MKTCALLMSACAARSIRAALLCHWARPVAAPVTNTLPTGPAPNFAGSGLAVSGPAIDGSVSAAGAEGVALGGCSRPASGGAAVSSAHPGDAPRLSKAHPTAPSDRQAGQ